MFDYLHRRRRTAGLPPGSPVYVGKERTAPVTVEMITYDAGGAEVVHPKHLSECACFDQGPKVTWINIDSLHDMNLVNQAAEVFRIHPLVVEDIVHTGQRPKMEELKDSIFVVLKMLSFNEKEGLIEDEQVSFLLGARYLLTFQEHANGDVFDEVRKRILSQKGRVGTLGPDYLLYALMDTIVDNYFVVLERIGDRIEDIEESSSSLQNQRIWRNCTCFGARPCICASTFSRCARWWPSWKRAAWTWWRRAPYSTCAISMTTPSR